MSHTPSAQSWSALVLNEIGIEKFYASVICTLAVHEHITNPGDDPGVPTVEDAEQIFNDLNSLNAPKWWPKHMGRIELSIRSTPEDGNGSETKGPVPVDPNTPDHGIGTFKSMLINLLDALGEPYDGTIEIRTRRLTTNEYLGTTKHKVAVASNIRRESHGGPLTSDRWVEKELRWQTDQREKSANHMLTMFSQASAVIGASAQALQATRGVNMAPPMEAPGDGPMWQQVVLTGMQILQNFASTRGQVSGAERVRQLATMPMPGLQGGYMPGYMPPGYAPQLLADPVGPPTDQPASPDGEFDGFFVKDEFMVEEAATMEAEEEEEMEVDADAVLDEMDADEVGSLIERWIDRHPEQRDAVREMGMGLARKIM